MRELDLYKKKIEYLFNSWNSEVDELEAEFMKAGSDPKADYDEVILALRRRYYKQKELG
jgi:hypothetical protein